MEPLLEADKLKIDNFIAIYHSNRNVKLFSSFRIITGNTTIESVSRTLRLKLHELSLDLQLIQSLLMSWYPNFRSNHLPPSDSFVQYVKRNQLAEESFDLLCYRDPSLCVHLNQFEADFPSQPKQITVYQSLYYEVQSRFQRENANVARALNDFEESPEFAILREKFSEIKSERRREFILKRQIACYLVLKRDSLTI